jgi:hypothetical protein
VTLGFRRCRAVKLLLLVGSLYANRVRWRMLIDVARQPVIR